MVNVTNIFKKSHLKSDAIICHCKKMCLIKFIPKPAIYNKNPIFFLHTSKFYEVLVNIPTSNEEYNYNQIYQKLCKKTVQHVLTLQCKSSNERACYFNANHHVSPTMLCDQRQTSKFK